MKANYNLLSLKKENKERSKIIQHVFKNCLLKARKKIKEQREIICQTDNELIKRNIVEDKSIIEQARNYRKVCK